MLPMMMQARDANSDLARLHFYQTHLNRVSRSFAFCIERLESPLRGQVSLAYLLCRILDTIEDAPWGSKSDQRASFADFESFLSGDARAESLTKWISRFPREIPEGERLLLLDAGEIFADFRAMPEKLQVVFRDAIGSMASGMKHFMSRNGDGPLRLSSLQEVNQYCFYVAGVVGEILTRVLSEQKEELGLGEDEVRALDLVDAYRFGLFLQKVNLLKDQRVDESVGRFLVPERTQVLASLKGDAAGAIRYVTNLPERFVGYRLFCSWSLFLGLASLPYIERSYQEELSSIKISREETGVLLGEIEGMVRDNESLRSLFEEMLSEALKETGFESGSVAALTMDSGESIAALYRGRLSAQQVEALFLSC